MPGETLECAEVLKKFGQDHVLQYWGILTQEERQSLILQLASVNFKETNAFFKKCVSTNNNNENGKATPEKMQPLPKERYCCPTPDDELHFTEVGHKAIAQGEVGVLLLAGGQGTRLGVPYPKGMFNVGLPSGKVLYQLQAERILRLQEIVRTKYQQKVEQGEYQGKLEPKITWYIMTSEATDELTEAYFKDHSYFGLEPSQVRFFEQGVLPCYDFEGKIIMDSRSHLAMAPDGNGGLYKALHKNGILNDMEKRGVKYLHVYGVDNILVRVADPAFVGYCIEKNADCGNKVVEKTDPKEPVGVVCWHDGAAYVVEYSELPSNMAELRDDDGRLTFRAGNIANHFFTTAFLRRVSQECEHLLAHHSAKKKIPYYGPKDGGVENAVITPTVPNGIKMEKFVFDVFQFSSFCRNFFVYEVQRSVEFSPLKNASGQDSPATCRRDLFALHRKWLEANGATVVVEDGSKEDDAAVEVSTLLAYYPESLRHLVDGKQLQVPVYLKADVEKGGEGDSSELNGGSGGTASDNAEKELLFESSTKDKTLPIDTEEDNE